MFLTQGPRWLTEMAKNLLVEILCDLYILPNGDKKDKPCLRKGDVGEFLGYRSWDDGNQVKCCINGKNYSLPVEFVHVIPQQTETV